MCDHRGMKDDESEEHEDGLETLLFLFSYDTGGIVPDSGSWKCLKCDWKNTMIEGECFPICDT